MREYGSQHSDAHLALDHDLQTTDNVRPDDPQKFAKRVALLFRDNRANLKHASDLPVAVIECLRVQLCRREEDVKLIKRVSHIVGLVEYISLSIRELKVAIDIGLQSCLELLLLLLRILTGIEGNVDSYRHLLPHLHSQLVHL